MRLMIAENATELGRNAAADAGQGIEQAIQQRGRANIVVATGASQIATLDALVDNPRIDWSKVTGFHLDEYLGLPASHPASFRRYLRERLVDRVPLAAFHYVHGDADDPIAHCRELGRLIAQHPIDVALVGIGENGHLAFNDPPADFETDEAYLVVELDDACRRQQLGEGWFAHLDDVPRRAISMSVRQILRSSRIVCSVPDERKSLAVARAMEGPVTPDVPASILQRHDEVAIYLDPPAAACLYPND